MSRRSAALAAEAQPFEEVAALLGGQRVLGHPLRGPLDAHEMIAQGLPGAALTHLVGHLALLGAPDSLEKALGMSFRTFQRHKEAPERPLSQEQSGRAWKFAEILAKAIAVFGSQEEAEQWLARPATGLEQRRPLDLLSTPKGTEIVEEFLDRLDHGVYT